MKRKKSYTGRHLSQRQWWSSPSMGLQPTPAVGRPSPWFGSVALRWSSPQRAVETMHLGERRHVSACLTAARHVAWEQQTSTQPQGQPALWFLIWCVLLVAFQGMISPSNPPTPSPSCLFHCLGMEESLVQKVAWQPSTLDNSRKIPSVLCLPASAPWHKPLLTLPFM